MQRRLATVSAASLLAIVAVATTNAAESLPSSIRACTAVADATDRLACFDRAVAALTGQAAPRAPTALVTASAAAPGAPAAMPAARSPTPEEAFGATGELARKQRPPEEEPKTLDRLTAKVTGLRTTPTGQLVVTLDNGQIWQQLSADPMALRTGQDVTIKPASFHSFWMVDPSGRGSRVKRIQ